MAGWIGRLFYALCLTWLLAGCGGGGNVLAPVRSNPGTGVAPPGSSARATMNVTVLIPAGRTSTAKTPAYVSASTQGRSINVYPALATPPPASAATSFNLAPGSSNCSSNSDGSRTCTLSIGAPVGNDLFAVAGYDQPPSICTYSNAPLTCNVLEQGTVPAQIAANGVALSLGGVVAQLAFAPNTYDVAPGTPTSIPLYLEALDAQQNIIVGPQAYASPVSLVITNNTCNTMSFSASSLVTTLTLNAPPANAGPLAVTVSYLGSYAESCGATFTGTVTVVPSVSQSESVGTLPANLVISALATSAPSLTAGSYESGAVAVAIAPNPTTSTGEVDVYSPNAAAPYASA